MLADLMTVSRAIKERPQYEHVQGPLEKSDPLLCLFFHGRHPTLNLAMMVDIRLSIVKVQQSVDSPLTLQAKSRFQTSRAWKRELTILRSSGL
jgi:hypothetical protein